MQKMYKAEIMKPIKAVGCFMADAICIALSAKIFSTKDWFCSRHMVYIRLSD